MKKISEGRYAFEFYEDSFHPPKHFLRNLELIELFGVNRPFNNSYKALCIKETCVGPLFSKKKIFDILRENGHIRKGLLGRIKGEIMLHQRMYTDFYNTEAEDFLSWVKFEKVKENSKSKYQLRWTYDPRLWGPFP